MDESPKIINAKLITLLRSLSRQEFRELEKFCASPYHSRERDLTVLYKTLKPFYPDFNDKKFTPGFLFSKIYPEEKYNVITSGHKIRMIFAAMYKVCQDFLIQLEMNNDSSRKHYYLMSQLRKKKLHKEISKVYSESKRESPLLKGSVSDFINKHALLIEYKNFLIEENDYGKMFDVSFRMREYITLSALIYCFNHGIERKVMASFNITGRRTLMQRMMECLDTVKLLSLMEKESDPDYPFIQIYHCAYRMQETQDLEHLHMLKELLRKHGNLFGTMEKFTIYVMMENFCMTKRFSTEHDASIRALFEIFNDMLKEGIYKVAPPESFNILRFRNMVRTALELDKFSWLEELIKNYSGELRQEHKDDMVNFSLAGLYHAKKEYSKALDHVMKVSHDLFIFKPDIKFLLMQIYYEMDYTEQLYSLADSTLHYVKNTKNISIRHRNSIRLFVKYIKILAKMKQDKNARKEIPLVIKTMETDKELNQKQWIVQKLNELISKKSVEN